MQSNNILLEVKEQIAQITFNRPQALNSLNLDTLKELEHIFTVQLPDENCRAIIVTGQDRAFVAGADIKGMQEMTSRQSKEFSSLGQKVFLAIEYFPAPVIAAINGFALGGGCELALACDIRLASEKAKFGQPEVNLGLIPGFGGTQRLSRLVGIGKAKELIFTGDIIGAQRAYNIGLVNHVFAPEELLTKAQEMAKKIAAKAPLAVQISKQSVNMGNNMDLVRGLELEAHLFSQSFETEDCKEGIQAFIEKRDANFTGK